MMKLKRFFTQASVALCLSLFLTSCGTGFFEHAQLGKPDFVGQPYVFKAFKVELVKKGDSPQTDVQERHRFPTTLVGGLSVWKRQRIRTPGGDHILRIEVKQADVVEEETIHDSFWSWFGPDSTFKYTGSLDVSLKLYAPGNKNATIVIDSKVEREMYLDSNTPTLEQQDAFNKLVLSMLHEFDTEMSFLIPQRMAKFLIAH